MTCPIPGCTHPTGSICTMAGCPGRTVSRAPASQETERAARGAGDPPALAPRTGFDVCHALAVTGETA